MIELTNTVAQVIQPGQAVTFDRVLVHTGCGECRRTGMPFVKLRTRGTYEINFSGNISGAVAGTPVQLAIALGGVGLPETVMEYTPSVANSFGNVSTGTFVRECCEGCDQITVINTGTVAVALSANMNLRIKRLS